MARLAFAACCLCLALMSGAMAARDLRGYGSTYSSPTYTPTGSYQPSASYPTGTSYPTCTLSPPPFEVKNVDKSAGYGDFTICFDLSAKGTQGYDLAALQLVVSDKCYDAVKSVTFGGKKYETFLTQYTNEKWTGVKIVGDKSLVTFASLYYPVKVCITLKGVCANADSLYNIITYFPVHSDNCATTSLYNANPSPYYRSPVQSYYPSPVYTYSPKYESPSPSPVYTYSPKYESPSPSPVYTYSPKYESPSPSPVYTYSPKYEESSEESGYSPQYDSPSPSYSYSPSYTYSSNYASPSPSYTYSSKYESPSPSPAYGY